MNNTRNELIVKFELEEIPEDETSDDSDESQSQFQNIEIKSQKDFEKWNDNLVEKQKRQHKRLMKDLLYVLKNQIDSVK